LIGVIFVEHVVADLRFVPSVGRAFEIADDDVLVPFDPGFGVLMLVAETDGVTELVRRRAAVEKTQIHRRFALRNAFRIGADPGPRTVVFVEGDADLGIGRIVEIEPEIGVLAPPRRLLAHGLFFVAGATHEAHAQGRAIDPHLAKFEYGTQRPAAPADNTLTAKIFLR
jgi:hypothetical protein